MGLNKQSGNMYGFITHTWNTIKGKCEYDCSYCYMKRFNLKEVRFDEKELKTYLGSNNFIFVGSGNDMFAENIPDEWIQKTLNKISIHSAGNKFLFQSKNPKRFGYFCFSHNVVFCTTIESNRYYNISNAPSIKDRVNGIKLIKNQGYDVMITIEPILNFDTEILLSMIREIEPIQVNIGADSKRCNLLEPDEAKIKELINGLSVLTKVFIKDNLKRLLKNADN